MQCKNSLLNGKLGCAFEDRHTESETTFIIIRRSLLFERIKRTYAIQVLYVILSESKNFFLQHSTKEDLNIYKVFVWYFFPNNLHYHLSQYDGVSLFLNTFFLLCHPLFQRKNTAYFWIQRLRLPHWFFPFFDTLLRVYRLLLRQIKGEQATFPLLFRCDFNFKRMHMYDFKYI